MAMSYKELDETLGPHIEVLFKFPVPGRLYHELVFAIESAQNEYESKVDKESRPPFRDEYLSGDVRARYDALRKQLRVYHGILLPCFTGK